jgi:hypothetical protein
MAIEGTTARGSSDGNVARPWRAPALLRIGTLMPFALALAIPLLAGPGLGGPLFQPAEVAGIPLWVIGGGLVLAWAAFGALVVWTTGSRLAATLAYVFITLPSMFALILGPAIILILQNLP